MHHLAINAFSAWERISRYLSGCQLGGSIQNISGSLTVQIWSVRPVAMAGIRTHMQWTADENAGFTDGQLWIAIYPDFPSGKDVADESDKPDSLLTHYHKLINLCNLHASMRVDEYLRIKADNEAILSYFTRQ